MKCEVRLISRRNAVPVPSETDKNGELVLEYEGGWWTRLQVEITHE